MSAFLEDIRPFYGNRERNDMGQTLEEFLEAYDPKRYEQPSVTVDTLVVQHPNQFDTVNHGLKVLMIQRGNHPSIGKWALPGGFIEMREDGIESAKRELQEETGIKADISDLHLLGIYSDPKRDIRGHTVSAVYVYFSDKEAQAADDAKDAKYFPINNLPENIAFDHRKILQDAKEKYMK